MKKKGGKTTLWRNLIVFNKPHVTLQMCAVYGIVLKEYTISETSKRKSLGGNLKRLINIHQTHEKKWDVDHIKHRPDF